MLHENEINEKFSSSNNILNTNTSKLPRSLTHLEDKSKLYLAEIYTLNKRIEKLHSELEEKTKNEKDLNKKLDDLEIITTEKLNIHIKQINDQKINIEKMLSEIQNLKDNHDHKDVIVFYEKRIEELEDNYKNSLKYFSKFFDKFSINPTNSTSYTITNRDEVWRNLLKKYETKILELQLEISECKKKERKYILRQNFFEKYCFKAEEKIEEITKISKKFYTQENIIKDLKIQVELFHKEIKEKNISAVEMNSENSKLKKENDQLRNIVNKINPILKIDWEEIEKENEEIFMKNADSKEFDFNNKNIIVLIENLNQFIIVFKDTISQTISSDIDINQISQIIFDIKNYTISLLKKIQTMSINQFYIINTCCDLYDKLKQFAKNNKAGLEFLTLLSDVKHSCAKLLVDYNPNL